MPLGDVAGWIGAAVALLTLAYVIYDRHASATAKRIVELDRRTDHLTGRVAKVENDIVHLPDKESTHRLELGLMGVQADLRVLSERLEPVAAISNRLQEFLLERGEG